MNSQERKEILEMVASGKIDIDEATRMLSGVETESPEQEEVIKVLKEQEPVVPVFESKGNGGRPRWFHVHVSDMKTGKSKVKVNIPVGLVKYGLAIGKRFSPEMAGLDIDELSSFMGNEKGLLVDVQDDEDGERVLIFVD
ncbi:MAG TPA: hypothetical protein VFI27_12200 [candidate division Zixibacteria bacterium]|nr:hypothetical protein [candidate division Zixibacteria bacterium]